MSSFRLLQEMKAINHLKILMFIGKFILQQLAVNRFDYVIVNPKAEFNDVKGRRVVTSQSSEA